MKDKSNRPTGGGRVSLTGGFKQGHHFTLGLWKINPKWPTVESSLKTFKQGHYFTLSQWKIMEDQSIMAWPTGGERFKVLNRDVDRADVDV